MSDSIHSEKNRPLIVKSQNLKHSTNMLFPNDPPTDLQIIKLKKIGYRGLIPCCRAKADYEIRKLEGRLEENEDKEKFTHDQKCEKIKKNDNDHGSEKKWAVSDKTGELKSIPSTTFSDNGGVTN